MLAVDLSGTLAREGAENAPIPVLFKVPKEPAQQAIADFWAMKTTGVGSIIELPPWLVGEWRMAA